MTTKKLVEEQHRCEQCLYLLNKEKTVKDGESHVKYNCMVSKCAKEKEGDGNG